MSTCKAFYCYEARLFARIRSKFNQSWARMLRQLQITHWLRNKVLPEGLRSLIFHNPRKKSYDQIGIETASAASEAGAETKRGTRL